MGERGREDLADGCVEERLDLVLALAVHVQILRDGDEKRGDLVASGRNDGFQLADSSSGFLELLLRFVVLGLELLMLLTHRFVVCVTFIQVVLKIALLEFDLLDICGQFHNAGLASSSIRIQLRYRIK